MVEDNKRYPNRELGQFLFLRDLIHLNRFELERNGSQVTKEMVDRCNMVLQYFNKLVKDKKVRLVIDSLPYITEATKVLSDKSGYELEFSVRANHMGIGDQLDKATDSVVRGLFPSKKLALATLSMFAEEKIKSLDHQYI